MARHGCIVMLICASALAADRPSFKVASIKPCKVVDSIERPSEN
jgi:hypothetical protein